MTDQTSQNNTQLPRHIAYNVSGEGDNAQWNKIGAAWSSKDDGLNVQLNAIPTDGRVVLRSREHLEKMRAERQAQQPAQNQSFNPQP